MKKTWLAVLLALYTLWCVSSAHAHEIRPAIATAEFAGDRYDVELSVNLESILAGVSPQHKDTNESPNAQTYNRLRELTPSSLEAKFQAFLPQYVSGIAIRFEAKRVPAKLCSVSIPPVGDTARARISTLHFCGAIPTGTKRFQWSYAAAFGDSILRLPAVDQGERVALWLKAGSESEPYLLGVGLQQKTRLEVAAQYTALGFTHILPKGLDHILFVLGLFLLSLRWKPLLVQVTAFTVAHTITLGLSIYGVVSLSPVIVEPLIAASIAYVAVENLITGELKPWRAFVVFGFGLLHGMGFAGVLREIGLPRSEFLTALLTFNLGVELGQLTVITLAYLLIGVWWRNKDWYRARVVRPLSALIALIGVYWTIERIVT